MTLEQVVLLDEHGGQIGVADKAEVHHQQTPLHLAFSCYVFDPAGRLLVTRRAAGKRAWPQVWTNSCCGHPMPGEPIRQAVRRRLADELGLVTVARLNLVLPGFRYRATMGNGVVENELCPVYSALIDAQPTPHPDEVEQVEWVVWRDFADRVMGGTREVSPWCRLQVIELDKLGPDPLEWPGASADGLPAAAR